MGTVLREDEQATAAWFEIDDGTPVLVMDTNYGQTVGIALSETAIRGVIDGVKNGPMDQR